MRKLTVMSAAAVLIAATAHAQNPEDEAKRRMERQFIMAERVPLEAAMKGAPYSADVVVEANQALADGNRISRKSTGRVYRDSEGRTRREEERQNGSLSISIVDPVNDVAYTLDPANRIAWKTPARTSATLLNKIEGARLEERRRLEGERAAAGAGVPAAPPAGEVRQRSSVPPPPPPPPRGDGDIRNVGPLERKTLEGILVEGRKNTSTIPTGQIGNEQPITITSEEWRSPELNVLVMTHHTDPRMGESSYRLTNIVRGEPDGTLFQIPAGYTVRETGIRREMPNER